MSRSLNKTMEGNRILFATLGSLGDLFPYLALASGMAAERPSRDDSYEFATTAFRVEQIGVRFLQADPDLDFSDRTFQKRAMKRVDWRTLHAFATSCCRKYAGTISI